MANEKIINVSHYTKWSEISDIQKRKKFEYIPSISYLIQKDKKLKSGPPKLLFGNIFSLWEYGLSIEVICKYAKNDINRKDELKLARKAYNKLKSCAKKCSDRGIADLICGLLLDNWEDNNEKIIFFIEGPPSDKIIARLSYLYPSLENLTICFLSFRPEDMITSVMSYQEGRLEFDIHRLLSNETAGMHGPYPGISDESLVQTYFYKHSEVRTGKPVYPLRIDFFCQGLLESDFENKKEIIKNILEDELWTSPYSIDGGRIETILPKGFIFVIDSWNKIYDKKLEKILKYDI